jgi:hypothetical protein
LRAVRIQAELRALGHEVSAETVHRYRLRALRRPRSQRWQMDHYLIGTTVLNTKIHQGRRYGHFFIMPEDNLIHLYEGTERAFINGVKVTPPPIEPGSMVMIYAEEGSMPRSNCACIVQAP